VIDGRANRIRSTNWGGWRDPRRNGTASCSSQHERSQEAAGMGSAVKPVRVSPPNWSLIIGTGRVERTGEKWHHDPEVKEKVGREQGMEERRKDRPNPGWPRGRAEVRKDRDAIDGRRHARQHAAPARRPRRACGARFAGNTAGPTGGEGSRGGHHDLPIGPPQFS